MYLSRLEVDPRNRAARRDLADCQQMHRTILSAFEQVNDASNGARTALGILFRVDDDRNGPVIYVQSREAPTWERLPKGYLLGDSDRPGGNPAIRKLGDVFARLEAGLSLRFRLLANPTRKIHPQGPDGSVRKNGTRVPLRDEGRRMEWLKRKAQESGFEVLHVSISSQVEDVRQEPRSRVRGAKRSGETNHSIELEGVLFDGRLRITDLGRFRDALLRGIGPGKAYGFGLLSLARG